MECSRFKFRVPMFTDKGHFIEYQYIELGDCIETTLCGYNGEPEQCIGLKDKNGKEIYEGDVVCYDDTPYNGYATKKTGVVVYRKAKFCYKYSDCCGGLYQSLVPSDDFWQRKTEIIGNIHEGGDND